MGDSKKIGSSQSTSSSVTQNDMTLQITPDKLDGSNYSSWSRSVKLYILGRGKWGYITGTKVIPTEADVLYSTWEEENAMVQCWLLNSMTRNLRAIFLSLSTAKEVWDAVTQTYSIGKDASKLYELRCKALATRQNGTSLSDYYGTLQLIWQEIDVLRPSKMKCSADIATRTKEILDERLYDFLAGLDHHLDRIRGQVLAEDPLPSVQAAYAQVCSEANRQATMLAGSHVDGSAMTTTLHRPAPRSGHPRPGQKEPDTRQCTHCGKNKHTRETCFELVGYPDWWVDKQNKEKEKKKSVANLTAQPTSTSSPHPGTSHYGLAMSTPFSASDKLWIIDSGASDHMTNNTACFVSHSHPYTKTVKVANGLSTPVLGAGSVSLSPSLSLSSVLHVPSLSHNLLSISQITKNLNCLAIFSPTSCLFQDLQTKEQIGHGKESGGLYYLDSKPPDPQIKSGYQVSTEKAEAEIWLWHKRLGHPSFQYLQVLFPSLFAKVHVSDFHCETCIFAKSHRASFPVSSNRSHVPFSLIHSDVWGPFHVPTYTGAKYFVSFIDDCTRVSWVYLLKNKSDVSSIFPIFHNMIQTQFHVPVQVVRSDNGGEYLNSELRTFFEQNGIIHQTSSPYTPQQNGIAERKNRHLLEVARSLCFAMHVPKRFWGDAICTAVYLINRVPSRVLQYQTPIQTLSQYHSIPSVLHIQPKVFGCVSYVHVHQHSRDKLDPRALKCVFVGYSISQKGYKCYYPPSGKIFVSMDVTFCEQETYFSVTPRQGEIDGEEEQFPDIGYIPSPNNDTHDTHEKELQVYQRRKRNEGVTDSLLPDHVPDQPATLHEDHSEVIPQSPSSSIHTDNVVNHDISARDNLDDSNESIDVSNSPRFPIRKNRGIPPERFGYSTVKTVQYPISDYVSNHRLSSTYIAFTNHISSVSTPSSLQDALGDPKWKIAMVEEMEALQKNCTWELVDLPKGKRPVGCKWVFTVKHKADGSVERYKARLVAKGYTQIYGVDYSETFAPVAKINTIRVLLSLAANLDWPLHQFDVKNAFLHGDLKDEVYMNLPPGFATETDVGKVCKLKKSLYGLKQSPRAWFGRFSLSMKRFGYKQSNSDHTLFLKHRKGQVTALIIYVDDMVVTGNDEEGITELQNYLAQEFEMKNLGLLKYFLGIEVARSKHGISLSQRKYILDLLSETGMLACKPAATPMEQNHKLGENLDQIPTNKERYQKLVGKLIYLSHTRPDIAYAVSVVSQFMHAPNESHMEAVLRILRYLKSAPGKGLMFTKHGHLDVQAYTDADYAGSIVDRRSTSGYFTFVGGNLVTWRSKKQKVVSRSSAEAEYRGMSHGVCELMWLRKLLKDLGCESKKAMNLHCDNKAAISIAHNPVQHDRTKHVEVDRHFIKEKLDAGIVDFPFVKSEDQLADILTKAVSNRSFHSCLDKLGIRNIYAPT